MLVWSSDDGERLYVAGRMGLTVMAITAPSDGSRSRRMSQPDMTLLSVDDHLIEHLRVWQPDCARNIRRPARSTLRWRHAAR
jgi:hypothetical protein